MMPFRTVSKIVHYFLVVFVMVDIIILLNYFLRDYGEKRNIVDINRTALIFFSITVVLFIADRLLKKKLKN